MDFDDMDYNEYDDEEMEEYDFQYSDDDEDDNEDVEIQNEYYNAKETIGSNPGEALVGFQNVILLEGEHGEWGFKSLKQIVKLHYSQNRHSEMLEAYKRLLEYAKTAVTRNEAEKGINSILDSVSHSDDAKLLERIYTDTLDALRDTKNERLWFKAQLRLGDLWFEAKQFAKLSKTLKELHKSCQKEDGSDDYKKGTQLLEICALEIQMYTLTKNNKKLKVSKAPKELYQKSLKIKSALPHPRIMGIIRECGGKMHMMECSYENAKNDFFEAFKSYDEAGSIGRIRCLKYLVLAHLLASSEINPFDAVETKPYQTHTEIRVMTSLIKAYQDNQVLEFERLLKENASIMEDDFIRLYIQDLLNHIRAQVLLHLLKPYTRIKIPFISKKLNIPEKDVESLLVSLILDNKLEGKIDQVNQILLLNQGTSSAKYTAIDSWIKQLEDLRLSITNKL